MFKGFEYNKECRKLADRGAYAQEHNVLIEFITSDNENVRLEYSTEREAINAVQALKNWCARERKPLKLHQRTHYVFAVKKGDEECR